MTPAPATGFPTIGKKFSNHWENRPDFSNHWKKVFQSLEKPDKIFQPLEKKFPIIGKLFPRAFSCHSRPQGAPHTFHFSLFTFHSP